MTTLLVCIILAVAPMAVYWNYKVSKKKTNIAFESVRSAIPYEYTQIFHTYTEFGNEEV